jgi:hypothetical protein
VNFKLRVQRCALKITIRKSIFISRLKLAAFKKRNNKQDKDFFIY